MQHAGWLADAHESLRKLKGGVERLRMRLWMIGVIKACGGRRIEPGGLGGSGEAGGEGEEWKQS